jgi:ubiquinone/menaquinone biosynthesis C-methylase UbiE
MALPAYAMNVSNFPEMYERWLVGPLFRPFAEVLVERARLMPGDRVLDIACGTGIVARVARERLGENGHVIGVDVSPQMLAVARTVTPAIDWREGDASALPLAEGERVDVILCQQGLQFFPDRTAAVAEMRRVSKRGGRLLVAVWQSLDEVPFFRETHLVAERRLGAFVDRRHSFGDALALERLIGDAGFEDVRIDRLTRTIRFDDPTLFVRMNTMALIGMSPASSTMNEHERARLVDVMVDESTEAVRQYSSAHGLSFELGANVAVARA